MLYDGYNAILMQSLMQLALGKVREAILSEHWTLREKCPCSELFWSAFSPIRTEYGQILHISHYSIRMRENADQNNSEYGHFLRSGNGNKSDNIIVDSSHPFNCSLNKKSF